ncbi:diguanylate cyclase/phosphodiesterase with PAS/PAC sensor [Burkholderiales bacterium GJ-E10]|nr:diguanylate cyclase/phosphodiesterase with PAS/PAC sensor [Burkholderiales bacterium GJ-E10]
MQENWRRRTAFSRTTAWSAYAAVVLVSTFMMLQLLSRNFAQLSQSQFIAGLVGLYLFLIVVLGTLLSLTLQRRDDEEALRIAAIAFESQEPMLVTDASGNILRVNQAFTRTTGYAADEVVGKNPRLLQSGQHDPGFYAKMWERIHDSGHWQGEVWDRHKNGSVYPKWLVISSVRGRTGQATHYVGSFSDLSERKEAAAAISRLAYFDSLTGLPNRRMLTDRLRHALVAATRNRQYGAILFLDLDNFKTVNDTVGHDEGDRLLQEAGRRLRGAIREEDMVARFGGDEFVIVLENLGPSREQAAVTVKTVADKLLAELAAPYTLLGREFPSSASIGATLWREHFTGHMHDLLKRADMAMYEAKKSGRNTVRFFDPVMQAAIEHRSRSEARLRSALAQDQFHLHFQPQVGDDGTVRGAEALLRWNDPERGWISPDEFIPIAEETGLIIPIGRWVLQAACAQLRQWSDSHRSDLRVAVNISAKQFDASSFVDEVREIVQASGADPRLLELELTETMLLKNVDAAIAKMAALRKLGITFALDDFGTGYSSLAYLQQLPLDVLKIDRTFVRGLGENARSEAIVRTIIQMAHNLNLRVLAEGVETEEQRRMLADRGCNLYQGYLFGKPLPAPQFERDIILRHRGPRFPVPK